MAWAVEHMRDGRDPLPEAWLNCRDVHVIQEFAIAFHALIGERDGMSRIRTAVFRCRRNGRWMYFWNRTDSSAVRRLRRAVGDVSFVRVISTVRRV